MLSTKDVLLLAIGRCDNKQAELARRIGALPQEVWNWLNRPGATVPAEYCPSIEQLTAPDGRRWHLRPQDWHRIWPELVGVEGAPDMQAEGMRDAA